MQSTDKKPSHLEIYTTVKQWMNDQPEFAVFIINGLLDGLAANAQAARRERIDWETIRRERSDWETIACMAMEERLFNGHEKFLADKIENMKSSNSICWDHTVEALRKKHRKALERTDD
jgi:hypothetical protein